MTVDEAWNLVTNDPIPERMWMKCPVGVSVKTPEQKLVGTFRGYIFQKLSSRITVSRYCVKCSRVESNHKPSASEADALSN